MLRRSALMLLFELLCLSCVQSGLARQVTKPSSTHHLSSAVLQARSREGPHRRLRRLASSSASQEHFITVGNTSKFYNGCKTFYVAGWNQWEVVEAGAGAPKLFGASLPPNTTGPQLIRDLMDKAVSSGLNVMRAFATAVDPQYPLEISPGSFNENIFRGLDYVLEQARLRGIKVILSLLDNWSNPGGIDQLVAWSRTAKVRTDFFTDANCIALYQQHVKTILLRVNSINGRRYLDDPVIMAWNLISEPRCRNCPDVLQSWLETMAAYVKSIDANHLLSIGSEGFYGLRDTQRSDFANPQGPETWANKEGQDFILNNQIQGIDFATVHSWADNWLDTTTTFQTSWIQQHDLDGRTILKKPVLIEEFGKWVKNTTSATSLERQQFYSLAYSMAQKSAASGGAIQGIAFWEWLEQSQVAAAAEGYGQGLYGITTDDPVWSTIEATAKNLSALSTPVENCKAEPASVPTVNSCRNTWVNGRQGTGFEGPGCDIDVNECVRGLAGCADNAACINANGSFACQCYWGFSGNGSASCTPTAVVSQLGSGYQTFGPDQLACSEGNDVSYPTTAPGWVDDPTGYSKQQGGFGSLLPVSVLGCQIACEVAGRCSGFSYNAALQQCFLKSEPSKTLCTSKESICTSANQNLVPQNFSCGTWQTYYRLAGAVSTTRPPRNSTGQLSSAG